MPSSPCNYPTVELAGRDWAPPVPPGRWRTGPGPPGTAPGSCVGGQAEPDLCEQVPEPFGLLKVGHMRGMFKPHELLAWCLQQFGVTLHCRGGCNLIVPALDHHDGGV